MADSTALGLTIVNVILLLTLSFTLCLAFIALHRLWEQALSIQYLINQLKVLAHEAPVPPIDPPPPRPVPMRNIATSISWPLQTDEAMLAPIPAAKRPPLSRADSEVRSRVADWESMRKGSPMSFV